MKLVGIGFAELQSFHLLFCIAIALCFNQISSTANEIDRLALLQFKLGITGDPFGALDSWNNSIGLCQWHGVTCGRRHRRVTVLDLSSHGLSGSISPHIGNLSFLREMKLQSNSFDGEIPPQVGQLRHLHILGLHNNSLVGKIPKNISGCLDLVVLSLGNNQLTGGIPRELGALLKLRQLNLYANNLTGSVPSSIGNLSSLEILQLTQNNLGGSIPQVLGHLTNLQFIGVGFNRLSGEIPRSLGDCIALTSLRIGGNFFHGSIPQSIRSLGGIEELDLSHNNLSGQIPEFLVAFHSLKLMNLSYNKFEGMLPCEGIFKNITGTSVIGKNDLCGGLPEFHLPNCISKSHKNKRFNITIFFLTFAISLVLGMMALCVTLRYLSWVKKEVDKPVPSLMDDSRLNISYETLLKATGNFSSTNLIGAGSFGSVYKAILEDNGMVVAVKVLHLVRRGARKSFTVECEASKNIRHRNILKILTVCSYNDHQGNDFKALVYEFMDNGSLKCWLHPFASSSYGNELPKKLNFIWRINIAIDVALALDYLHHQCLIPIVHCDLKPSNILLDAKMVAHVGDFGLAKFLDNKTDQMSSVRIRGTFGYTPPEYAMGSEASREGDVYSYGILLMEIFTGLRPTDDTFRDNLTLHKFVATALPERVLEITDNFLLQERESHFRLYSRQSWLSKSDNIFQECLVMLYTIGVACSDKVPGRRMSISKVADQLHYLREKLFESAFK
ncbi:hypothetical protein BT93_E1385 [Corymbia citriodora subsp. variegata]|nr:hypothetical protein BT93_E1385 [Corymbia citriodora subsp. variegata]